MKVSYRTYTALSFILILLMACSQDDTAVNPQTMFEADANLNWTAGEYWIDPRDGQSYGTVEIGGTVWMTRNFNFTPERGTQYYGPGEKWHEGELWGENHRVKSKKEKINLGQLYSFEQAQDLAPEGWRMPTQQEWEIFKTTLSLDGVFRGTYEVPEGYLTMDFQSAGKKCPYMGYTDLGKAAFFWTDTEKDQYHAQSFELKNRSLRLKLVKADKRSRLSVRYVKK